MLGGGLKLGVGVFECESIHAKIGIHTELKNALKNSPFSPLLCVFHSKKQSEFRLSLVTSGFDYEANKVSFSSPKRQSFILGHDKTATAQKALSNLIATAQNAKTAANSTAAAAQTANLQKPNLILADLEKAFSQEPVSKEFFENYKRHYEEFVATLLPLQHSEFFHDFGSLNGVKALEAFCKKLIARIVFLYFLQKKGWLGVPAGKPYGEGELNFVSNLFAKAQKGGENFYLNYLCPLFFQSLNRQNEGDLSPHFGCKIPFLNGGLFEDDFDAKFSHAHEHISRLLTNAHFGKLLAFFDTFNFTIEESSPSDIEVAIDPEMLGKVFENLIDYNKENGAFYTPRAIVHYMCQNALYNHFATLYPNNHAELKALVFNQATDNDFVRKNAAELQNALCNLKILDPAIGSGAFPMGLLHEMMSVLLSLNKTMSPQEKANHKRKLISNCIHGLDIDPDAIAIARLRFWLSIAVDEETLTPLPNLDFKFMQGNSLVEKICHQEVVPTSRPIATNSVFLTDVFGDFVADELAKTSLFTQEEAGELTKLFAEYFNHTTAHDKDQTKAKILKIMQEVFDKNLTATQRDITNLENSLADPALKPALKKRFTNDLAAKTKFKAELNILLNDYKQHNFATSKIFLYNFFFASVLNEGGFDIILGNPPYIRQEKIPQKEEVTAECQTLGNTADIYCYFFTKGYKLLKEGGFLSFITSNKFARAGYGAGLREFLLANTSLVEYIDLNGIAVFENATVDTAITSFKKLAPTPATTLDYLPLGKCEGFTRESNIASFLAHATATPQSRLSKEAFIFGDNALFELKSKIESVGTPLKEWDIAIYRGVLTGYNEAFIIDTATKEMILNSCEDESERERTAKLIKPILRGRDIKRYSYEWANLWLIGTFPALKLNIDDYPALKKYLENFMPRIAQSGEKGCRKKTSNKWFETQDNIAYYEDFEKEKIVYSEIVREPQFYLDDGEFKFGNFYAEATSFILTGNKQFNQSLKYLLGILHSKIATFAFKKFYAGGGLGGEGYRYKKAFLEKLPIPKISKEQEAKFVEVVNEILVLKKTSNDETKMELLENKLDQMVFELYGLNETEIISVLSLSLVVAMLTVASVSSRCKTLSSLLLDNFALDLQKAFAFCKHLTTRKVEVKGKIVWNRISSELCFSYDDKGHFILDSMFMINCAKSLDAKYLLAVLNSNLSKHWIKNNAATLGEGVYGAKIYIEKLPIPKITLQNQNLADSVVELVEQILTLKERNLTTDTSHLEREIDSLVFKLYGLTKEQISLLTQ